jgi:hypothetical protein
MTKKEKYGLEFMKLSNNGVIGYNCIREKHIVDKNNLLQFLTYLDESATQLLLREVNSHLSGVPDLSWTPYDSMALEHIDLQVDYPNFIIDGQPDTFPFTDIRDLLEEWLTFLQS